MPRPRSEDFSAHPGCHYFLALSITLLLVDLIFGMQVYYCWHTIAGANSNFCSSDRIMNEETAGHHALFVHASVIYYLLIISGSATIYAPFFLAAIYILRRWCIHQNVAGICY